MSATGHPQALLQALGPAGKAALGQDRRGPRRFLAHWGPRARPKLAAAPVAKTIQEGLGGGWEEGIGVRIGGRGFKLSAGVRAVQAQSSLGEQREGVISPH